MKTALFVLTLIFYASEIYSTQEKTAGNYDIAEMQKWLPAYGNHLQMRKKRDWLLGRVLFHNTPTERIAALSSEKTILVESDQYFALQHEAVANHNLCIKKLNRYEWAYRHIGMTKKATELKKLSENIANDPDFSNLPDQKKVVSKTLLTSERTIGKFSCYAYFFFIVFYSNPVIYWLLPTNTPQEIEAQCNYKIYGEISKIKYSKGI